MPQKRSSLDRISATSQWPERRGFERVYVYNPEVQAKLINNLFAMVAFEVKRSKDGAIIEALEMIIVAFSDKFPEYLSATYDLTGLGCGGGMYIAKPSLLHKASALIKKQELKVIASDALAFESLYRDNPAPQARLVEALFGFRAVHTDFATEEDSPEIVNEIELIIRAFTREFPDYLEPETRPDQRLIRMVGEVLEAQHAA